jgi:hypothetical protein
MSARDALRSKLESLLGGGLGLAVFPPAVVRLWARLLPRSVRGSAFWGGAKISVGYLLLFCGLPLAVHRLFSSAPSQALLALQVYGAFWAGWSTVTARLTSETVLGILERDILPRLSDDTCAKLAAKLDQRYPETRLRRQSWIIGAVAAALAGYLVYSPGTLIEVVWWAVGWAILFATGANVVAVASFYRALPDALPDALADRLWLDPVRSQLVESVARVGRAILLFWIGTAFSIALILLAGLDWSELSPEQLLRGDWPGLGEWLLLTETARFVKLEVPIAGFFAIVGGVGVFLSAEAGIRAAVRNVQLRSLERIDAEVGSHFARLDRLTSEEMKRLEELNTLHSAVAGAASYRGFVVSSLSVLLPFLPLLSLLLGNE